MLTPILLSVVGISLLSFIGVVTLAVNEKAMKKWMLVMVAFAAGTLLGAAFFNIMPEAVHELGDSAFTYILFGLLGFFLLEKLIFFHHCHDHNHDHKEYPYTYLNIVGDAIHNFGDGAIIAAAYLTEFHLGLITTIAIALHEIPQELGDFAILIHGGMKTGKALLFNFMSAATAIAGALLMFFLEPTIHGIIPYFIAIAGGGFIYIATVDLFPELTVHENWQKLAWHIGALAVGLALIYWLSSIPLFAH